MSDLYPTKTRLALLRSIADGRVTADWDSRGDTAWTDERSGRVVTSRVREMSRAGWVVIASIVDDLSLTDAGREVLRGAS